MFRRIAIFLLAMLLARPVFGGDSLDSLRQDVRTSPPESPSEPESASPPSKSKSQNYSPFGDRCECDEDNNDEFWSVILLGAGVVVTSPFWGPHAILESEHTTDGYFAAYPYEYTPGSMLFEDELAEELAPQRYSWLMRLRGEYADDFDSLSRYGGHLLVDTNTRLGFDTEVNYWRQSFAPGVYDNLWQGDANVLIRFAQNESMQMRSGIGLNWMADDTHSDFGFNFTYGGDIYPLRPFVISADLDAGWLGEATLIHLRSTVGVQWKQVEVYTGYDYLEIGDTQLDGLVAGVRLTF